MTPSQRRGYNLGSDWSCCLSFYTEIGPLRLQTFTLALALAVLASLVWGFYRLPQQRAAWVDAALAALFLGLIGARAGHVLLNWNYFAYNAGQIPAIREGGLDWHGGLLGGLLGLLIVARWRKVAISRLLDLLTPALPLLALAGWWGCAAANCAYGAELNSLVDGPALLVAELRDVYGIPAPRYRTQFFGLSLALLGLALAALLIYRGWLVGLRFWLLLALLSVGMFAIGFVRADFAYVIAGLRADQWLDMLVIILSLLVLITGAIRKLRTSNGL